MKHRMNLMGMAAFAALLAAPTVASAADVEVIHWWTSKGESAAVSEFAKALDANGQDKWIDSAIALGETARATVMQRALGGDPPEAAQFNPGRQYEELIAAGLLLDLTDLATEGKWEEVIRPKQISAACQVDGKWWCVPVNIHSNYWAWYSKPAFAKAGYPRAEEPRRIRRGRAEAQGSRHHSLRHRRRRQWLADPAPVPGHGDRGARRRKSRQDVHRQERRDRRRCRKCTKVFEELRALKKFTDDGYANRNWNDTTNLVITNKAGLQVMGDWARGEFAAAGMTGVKDFGCIIGLNEDKPLVSTDGDIILFFKQDDPEVEAAQKRLAKLLISPEVQVAFNNAKGSMPVRADVDMSTADPCMQKALKAVDDPAKIVDGDEPVHHREHQPADQRADRAVLLRRLDDRGRRNGQLRRNHRELRLGQSIEAEAPPCEGGAFAGVRLRGSRAN